MKRLTLRRYFVASAIAIVAIVGTGATLFLQRSLSEIRVEASREQAQQADQIRAHVVAELGRAERIVQDLDRGVRSGAILVDDRATLEAQMFTRLAHDIQIEEVTFTRAEVIGYNQDDEPITKPNTSWKLSVGRSYDGKIRTRLSEHDEALGFGFSEHWHADDRYSTDPFKKVGPADDPATDFTFVVLASKYNRGKTFWSDLHFSDLDQEFEQTQRRRVLSVQRAIEDASGKLVGVIRVGLLTDEIDRIVAPSATERARADAQRFMIVTPEPDKWGVRHVARVQPDDSMKVFDNEDVRYVSTHPPDEVTAFDASDLAKGLDPDEPERREGELRVNGRSWLVTLEPLALGQGGTSNWMIVVLAPEERYTKQLIAFRRTLVIAFAALLGLVLVVGAVMLMSIQRGLNRVVRQTTRMRGFNFEKSSASSAFREIDDVINGVERAKTVVRAMGKYIPIDLVRRLYASNAEPELGGDLQEVSLMFTDIEGFTSLSEKLEPDALARKLGDYLAAMTSAIEATNGTIDKYIGDAIMAIWNAPTAVADHPRQACRAALACIDAAKKLYASPAWQGLPALVTRFGIHKATVLVGHFGAPTRLSYTALGDGVNLAARLEPLCKQYGVIALASEAVVQEAEDEFVFRRIDRVAVKGKTQGIDVYELLGRKGQAIEGLARARRYEAAFEMYLARDFDAAISKLEQDAAEDPPSAVLLARCQALREEPPPASWDGVHSARSK